MITARTITNGSTYLKRHLRANEYYAEGEKVEEWREWLRDAIAAESECAADGLGSVTGPATPRVEQRGVAAAKTQL